MSEASRIEERSAFPLPTSMSPGSATVAVSLPEYIEATFGDLQMTTIHKILHDNAACIYNLA